MDVRRLIDALRRPEAYPHPVDHVEIRQTHISVVALVGPYVYKVKKPVDLGFLDFSTLARRRHFCHEEVRLNRRLAPKVYHGVVPLAEADGFLRVEGEGQPVEFAVKMERLPDEATLLGHLERGELDHEVLTELGRRIAAFHAGAASAPEIDRYGCWEVVALNARENLDQSRGHVGRCLSAGVLGRLGEVLEERLGALRPLVDARARAHVPRDTHGDLHLEHIYLFPDRPPPDDVVVIDCIEFNERFRYADPVADMAFLAMDLRRHGRRDLAKHFADGYFLEAGDEPGRSLLDFYVAYRAAVRAKVRGMAAKEWELPPEERDAAERRARGHWLLALSELEDAGRRPGLILVGGLPGTGKSTLAERLGQAVDFEVVSSDRVRKGLAGLAPDAPAPARFSEGIYTPEWNDRTYAACLRRAGELLFQGRRVLVDASFHEAARRETFLAAAVDWGVRTGALLCSAPPETVRRRLEARRGGASDADWAIYRASAARWEQDDKPDPRWPVREVPTGGSSEEAVAVAVGHLRDAGLAL